MATAAVTSTRIGTYAFRYSWSALGNGDTGTPVDTTDLADQTFQVLSTGTTFGVGGTVVLEGSADNVDYFPLRDPSSTVISMTAAGGRGVLEHSRFVRPRISAGDGSTSILVVLFARRTSR